MRTPCLGLMHMKQAGNAPSKHAGESTLPPGAASSEKDYLGGEGEPEPPPSSRGDTAPTERDR